MKYKLAEEVKEEVKTPTPKKTPTTKEHETKADDLAPKIAENDIRTVIEEYLNMKADKKSIKDKIMKYIL
ncbi:MAG: hypothetical protein KGD61_10995 [Candidatus Lokiarchaeota archaeon]|nr:hypothetical protein [Candidatus Lokiarchaeota archaeon]